MAYAQFEQLKSEIVANAGFVTREIANEGETDEPAALSMEVDDVPVMLAAIADEQEGQAMLCADFGEIPPERETEVMRAVLDTNLPLYRDMGATMCTNPLTGHLLALKRIALAEATLEGVVEMARQFASGVHRFNRDQFGAGESVVTGGREALVAMGRA